MLAADHPTTSPMASPSDDDPQRESNQISRRIRRRQRDEQKEVRQQRKLRRTSKRFGRSIEALTRALIGTTAKGGKRAAQRPQQPQGTGTTQPPDHVTRALRRQARSKILQTLIGSGSQTRPVNAQGFSTFHFRVRPISKSLGRPGRGSAHQRYLERASAVDSPSSEAQRGDHGRTAVDAADRAGGTHQNYLERPTAIAGDHHGRYEVGNIGDTPAERQQFWDLVEDYESEPATDYLTIHRDGLDALPDLLARPDCPEILKNADLAKCERKNGLTIPGFEPEINQAITWLKQHSNAIRPDIQYGRGGRIQFRMELEFPHEITGRQRYEILQRFTQALFHRSDGPDLPYYGCLHQPDQTNDERNHHGHIVFHDRPTEKIDGRWDFTVPKRRANRHMGDHAKKKDRSVHDITWPAMAKNVFADLCNEYLAAGGHKKRMHPGGFEELGIQQKPTTHIGTDAAALERAGVETAAAAATARTEATRADQAITDRREKRRQVMEAEVAALGLIAEQLAQPDIARQLHEFRTNRAAVDDFGEARDRRELADRRAYGRLEAKRHALDNAIRRLEQTLAAGTARKPDRAAAALEDKRRQRQTLETEIATLQLQQIAASTDLVTGAADASRKRKLAREAYIDLAVLSDRTRQARLTPKEIAASRRRLQRLADRAALRRAQRLGDRGQSTT